MLKKIGYIQLFNALKESIEPLGIKVLDAVPKDEESPFYLIEFVNRENNNTKTQWREDIEIWIHAIAEPGDSREQIFEMVQKLEEVMTTPIDLGKCVDVLHQEQTAPFNITQDETEEWHAVLGFKIRITYGYRVKI